MSGTSRPIRTSWKRSARTRRHALPTTQRTTPQWSRSMASSSSNISTIGVPRQWPQEGLPMPGSLLMVSLSSLQSMFFQLIARSFFNLTLPSCVLSLPTALSCGTSAVTIPKSVPLLRPVGLLSMTNPNRGVTPVSPFSLLVSPVHASRFSPAIANKPVQGQAVTFYGNLCSNVWPTKESAS